VVVRGTGRGKERADRPCDIEYPVLWVPYS
jgi:hypothetical protein